MKPHDNKGTESTDIYSAGSYWCPGDSESSYTPRVSILFVVIYTNKPFQENPSKMQNNRAGSVDRVGGGVGMADTLKQSPA